MLPIFTVTAELETMRNSKLEMEQQNIDLTTDLQETRKKMSDLGL